MQEILLNQIKIHINPTQPNEKFEGKELNPI